MSLRKKIRMQKCGSGERETVLCIFSFAGRKEWREKYSVEEENVIIEHLWEHQYTKERCDNHDDDVERQRQTTKGLQI